MAHFKTWLLLTVAFLTVASFIGCGGGEKDRLKRMMAAKAKARKEREAAEGDGSQPAKKKNNKGNAGKKNKGKGKASAGRKTAAKTTEEERILQSAGSDDQDFVAFKEKMLAKFEERARNMTHIDKLEAIGRAMAERIRTYRTIPTSGIPGREPALSWRVGLLPFLGYKELYDQFDTKRRYNSPINKRLIQLIPPEFQTSGEFGKTNIVVPLASFSMYKPKGVSLPVRRVEDGIADTVAIVEVDDKHAQIWTAPVNFIVNQQKPTTGMGEKYGFIPVIFGDGRVEQARKNTRTADFRAMLSFDAGDSYPLNTTKELVQTDFGLKGFGPKQQLVMQGARGAVNLIGSLREGNVSKVTTTETSKTSGETSANSNSVTSVSLANKFQEGSMTALKDQDMAAAFNFEYAAQLVGNGEGLKNYGWCKAIQRPVLAPRWSVGILYPVGAQKFDPLKRAKDRVKSAKLPGDKILMEKTGQVGQDAMIVLRKMVADGKFGEYLTEQIGIVNANQNRVGPRNRRRDDDDNRRNDRSKKSSDDELFDSRKIPDLHYPGIEIHEGNTRAYHMKVAKDRGNDLLLLIDVDLRAWAQSKMMQITTIYVIDVQRGKELWKSAPLNSLKIRAERSDATKDDTVFVELKELWQFCQDNVALVDLPPNLSRDNVLNRLKILEQKKTDNKLPILAEGKFYLQSNLILQTDYTQFCINVLGKQQNGLQLAVGDDSQKFEILKPYLPLQYSLELSQ